MRAEPLNPRGRCNHEFERFGRRSADRDAPARCILQIAVSFGSQKIPGFNNRAGTSLHAARPRTAERPDDRARPAAAVNRERRVREARSTSSSSASVLIESMARQIARTLIASRPALGGCGWSLSCGGRSWGRAAPAAAVAWPAVVWRLWAWQPTVASCGQGRFRFPMGVGTESAGSPPTAFRPIR